MYKYTSKNKIPKNKVLKVENFILDYLKEEFIKNSKRKTEYKNVFCVSIISDSFYISPIGTAVNTIKTLENLPDELTVEGIKFTKSEKIEDKIYKWWEKDIEMPEGYKWVSLSHNGLYFSDIEEPYEPFGLKLRYINGKEEDITTDQEEVLMLYTKRLISEDGTAAVETTKGGMFNKNFNRSLEYYFKKPMNVEDIDFTEFKEKQIAKSERNKETRNKYRIQCKNKTLDIKYKYATLNGVKEAFNYRVEPMGIFMGRGNNLQKGLVKKKVYPEDVTLNLDENAEIPSLPEGYTWGEITHDHTDEWFSKYRQTFAGGNNSDNKTLGIKYQRSSGSGMFKSKNDFLKYEVARKLNLDIDEIRKTYFKDLTSDDDTKREMSSCLYLIDHFGIRPGDETTEDKGVVGATTLKAKDIKVDVKGKKIILDFKGKDSIAFYKKLDIPNKDALNNFKKLSSSAPDSPLFEKVSSDKLNEYIKNINGNGIYTAKNFRTRLGSSSMFHELENVKVPPFKGTAAQEQKNKKRILDGANYIVAQKLNHVKAVIKKGDSIANKLNDQLEAFNIELDKLKSEGENKKGDIVKVENKIKEIELKLSIRDTGTALTTSKQNYIDPRIILAWCKKEDLKEDKAYSKVLLKKFTWAVDMINSIYDNGDTWSYVDTPINEQLVSTKYSLDSTKRPRPEKSKPRAKTSKKTKIVKDDVVNEEDIEEEIEEEVEVEVEEEIEEEVEEEIEIEEEVEEEIEVENVGKIGKELASDIIYEQKIPFSIIGTSSNIQMLEKIANILGKNIIEKNIPGYPTHFIIILKGFEKKSLLEIKKANIILNKNDAKREHFYSDPISKNSILFYLISLLEGEKNILERDIIFNILYFSIVRNFDENKILKYNKEILKMLFLKQEDSFWEDEKNSTDEYMANIAKNIKVFVMKTEKEVQEAINNKELVFKNYKFIILPYENMDEKSIYTIFKEIFENGKKFIMDIKNDGYSTLDLNINPVISDLLTTSIINNKLSISTVTFSEIVNAYKGDKTYSEISNCLVDMKDDPYKLYTLKNKMDANGWEYLDDLCDTELEEFGENFNWNPERDVEKYKIKINDVKFTKEQLLEKAKKIKSDRFINGMIKLLSQRYGISQDDIKVMIEHVENLQKKTKMGLTEPKKLTIPIELYINEDYSTLLYKMLVDKKNIEV